MKSNNEIAEQILRFIDRTINNELPTVSCPEKMDKVRWKREEVRRLVISGLQQQQQPTSAGPQQIKG